MSKNQKPSQNQISRQSIKILNKGRPATVRWSHAGGWGQGKLSTTDLDAGLALLFPCPPLVCMPMADSMIIISSRRQKSHCFTPNGTASLSTWLSRGVREGSKKLRKNSVWLRPLYHAGSSWWSKPPEDASNTALASSFFHLMLPSPTVTGKDHKL